MSYGYERVVEDTISEVDGRIRDDLEELANKVNGLLEQAVDAA